MNPSKARRHRVGRVVRLALGLALALVLGLSARGVSLYHDPARSWRDAVLDDDDGQRRWDAVYQAVRGRAEVPAAVAITTLAESVNHPSFRIRQTAVMGLGKFGFRSRRHISRVIALLKDPDVWVRGSAAWSLGEILAVDGQTVTTASEARRQALLPLVKALGDQSVHVRLAAAKALAKLGAGRAAIPVLVVGLQPRNGIRRFESLEALRAIGLPDALAAAPAMIAMAADSAALEHSADVRLKMGRIYAAETLFQLGRSDDALEILGLAERSTDRLVRTEARQVRRRLVERHARPWIRVVSALEHKSPL